MKDPGIDIMDVLTKEEVVLIVSAFLSEKRNRGAGKRRIAKVLAKCATFRLMNNFLKLVLEGEMNLDLRGDELFFIPRDSEPPEPQAHHD